VTGEAERILNHHFAVAKRGEAAGEVFPDYGVFGRSDKPLQKYRTSGRAAQEEAALEPRLIEESPCQ